MGRSSIQENLEGKLAVNAVFEGTAAVGLVELVYEDRDPIVPPDKP
jgi:hypothetical protein